jgi:hypothetical protein
MADVPRDWTFISDYTNHPEAELARNLLQGHGIDVFLWSDDCGGMGVGQTVIQRVRLFVARRDAPAAARILGVPKRR